MGYILNLKIVNTLQFSLHLNDLTVICAFKVPGMCCACRMVCSCEPPWVHLQWHHSVVRNQTRKEYLYHGICKHCKSGLTYCFVGPLDIRKWKSIKCKKDAPINNTKHGENLPVFRNYDSLQQRSHLHHWQMSKIRTCVFMLSLSFHSVTYVGTSTSLHARTTFVLCVLSCGCKSSPKMYKSFLWESIGYIWNLQ